MPILTPQDKAAYFPEVKLEDEALQSAIWRAEAIAEGARGANRPLSISRYQATVNILTGQQVCFIPYWPIVEIIKLEGRQRQPSAADNWGRMLPAIDWTEVDAAKYELNPVRGQILLFAGLPFTECRVEYLGGWNFEQCQDVFDVKRIKTIVAQILLYQQTAIGLGYKSDGDVDMQAQKVGEIPDEYLIPLHAYRARQTYF